MPKNKNKFSRKNATKLHEMIDTEDACTSSVPTPVANANHFDPSLSNLMIGYEQRLFNLHSTLHSFKETISYGNFPNNANDMSAWSTKAPGFAVCALGAETASSSIELENQTRTGLIDFSKLLYQCGDKEHIYRKLVAPMASKAIWCDAPNGNLAECSIKVLQKQLDYFAASYDIDAPYFFIQMPSFDFSYKKLVNFLRQYLLQTLVDIKIVLVLPCNETYDVDPWNHWTRIHRQLLNECRVLACLRIGVETPQTFYNIENLKRWRGERLFGLWIDDALFEQHFDCVSTNTESLPLWQIILTFAVVRTNWVAIIGAPPVDVKKPSNWMYKACQLLARINYVTVRHYLRQPYQELPETTPRWFDNADTLRFHLQPQAEYLGNDIYGAFVGDSAKYVLYRDAMYDALAATLRRRMLAGLPIRGVKAPMIRVMVLGIGARAPLVNCLLNAFRQLQKDEHNMDMKLVIVANDHNQAMLPLIEVHLNMLFEQQISRNHFQSNGITLHFIMGDMRDISVDDNEKADIIVSELLGGFACNELSPECLEGCIHRLGKADAFIIPKRYCSYVAPIGSKIVTELVAKKSATLNLTPMIRNNVTSTRIDDEMKYRHVIYSTIVEKSSDLPNNVFDEPSCLNTLLEINDQTKIIDINKLQFVTQLPNSFDNIFYINLVNAHQPFAHNAKCIFEFEHSVTEMSQPADTSRDWTSASFTANLDMDLTGMAGYFDAELFGKNESASNRSQNMRQLSINPKTHTAGMHSWFPAYFPFRGTLRLKKNETLTVRMRRCVTPAHVWYEWQVVAPVKLPVQNADGRTFSMMQRRPKMLENFPVV